MTRDEIKTRLSYDAKTGVFVWKKARRDFIGRIAGSVGNHGYISIQIDGKKYLAHRLAWLYVKGYMPEFIDHKNGERRDNRIGNLREATKILNGQNQRLKKNKTLGVDFFKPVQKWRARIIIEGKSKFLGHFASRSAAQSAYIKAKRKLHKGCTI